MDKLWRSALFLLLAPLFFAQVASADTILTFGYSDVTGNIANATISASDLGGGTFLVNSGTLTVTGGLDVGTYSLFANPGGAAVGSPSGAFIFDDLLLPGSDPFLDVEGLLFTGNGLEINLFGNGPNDYTFDSHNSSGYNVLISGGGTDTPLAAVPEPSSFALLGLGGAFFLLGLRIRQ